MGSSWDTVNWCAANNNVKKYEVYETSEDILALSVTWHRLRPTLSHNVNIINDPSYRPTKLTDEILFKEMIQEDRERAHDIRDYYSKKLMVLTLKDHKLSNYRKDLNTFIHGDCKIVKEQMMPLVYRLPEFYDYDIEVENMFRGLDTRFDNAMPAFGKLIQLEPIKKLTVNSKSKKFVEYWLKDSTDRPYKIEIDVSNQLMHLWDHFFDKGSVFLDVVAKPTSRDGASYYKLIRWKLA